MARDAAISKYMSLVLRHDPAAAGLVLDEAGWTDFDALCRAVKSRLGAEADDVRRVIAESPKQRFTIKDGRVRAAQGHSVSVDLDLAPAEPPKRLYHGTSRNVLGAILAEGLRRGARHHVHLSSDIETARIVGARHGGKPVVLSIDAAGMAAAGAVFFRSDNGVWLVEAVPPAHIEVLEGAAIP
ncbi:RNA 2'-phosphotransferase [Antarcticirhabdus aurantiaca]|uniref:RNA 2'-phosphotransferase n=1 Tax=Antarcticirhabdus aurantiaca TaxID=2606717 RepID=A0ACD4NVN5_9HYPH|nr:RNA 2'-phosphotransferase [Antarcticirhabdus aurantiaca]WAJ30702.1 RNA 2'-phosphotransferase [Jeongeuplla avenae]